MKYGEMKRWKHWREGKRHREYSEKVGQSYWVLEGGQGNIAFIIFF